MSKVSFEEILKYRKLPPPATLLSLDPGETTGWACFENGAYHSSGQIDTSMQPMTELRKLFTARAPTAVVAENYVVYSHKLKSHTNNKLITARVLGMIQGYCEEEGLPLYLQMASQAKGFVHDQRLRDWNMWQIGEKHARDAIRHALYFLIFGSPKKRTMKGPS